MGSFAATNTERVPSEKFDVFKNKIKKMMEEQDYQSESQESEGVEAEETLEQEEGARDQTFLKKSLKMQKEGKVSLLSIIKKE